jgi:rod shape-determining protein MreC
MKARSRYALALLALIVLAALLLQTPLLSSARRYAWDLWVRSIGGWFRIGPLTVPENVADHVARLTAENARLKAEVVDLGRLREQLGAPSYDGFAAIPAEVMPQPLDPFQTRLVINRGAKGGIMIGAPAVVAGSTLVGFITELGEYTATLQLLSHPATNFPAELLADDATSRGLVRGKAFTTIELASVPRDIPLSVGQTVVSASQPGRVPAGLLIGQITSFEDELHEPFQQARIAVPYDPERLFAVSVLIPR